VLEEAEQHQDVEQRLMIRHHDVGRVVAQALAVPYRHEPVRKHVGVERRPGARVQMQDAQPAVERYRDENPGYGGPIPSDAVTASGSGLDPHISPANAQIQAERVARARGVAPSRVTALLERRIEQPWLGFIGERRVNVLLLNLDLDRELGPVGTPK